MGAAASVREGYSAKVFGEAAAQAGDYVEAALWWTQCINDSLVNQNDSNRLSLALLYCDRSEAFRKIGKFDIAVSDGKEAISLNPVLPKGYIQVAEALVCSGRHAEAEYYLHKAKVLDSNIEAAQNSVERGSGGPARLSQGSIFSWGSGSTTALGHPASSDKINPTMIEALRGKHLVDASCGAMHCIAVTGLGDTYSWGNNKYGQIGMNDSVSVCAGPQRCLRPGWPCIFVGAWYTGSTRSWKQHECVCSEGYIRSGYAASNRCVLRHGAHYVSD